MVWSALRVLPPALSSAWPPTTTRLSWTVTVRLAIYPAAGTESDHRGTQTPLHQMRRGAKHAAAQRLRAILANDDRAVTLHTVAARTDRALLPTTVAALLDRDDQRRAQRAQTWRQHCAETRRIQASYENLIATSAHTAQRERKPQCGTRLRARNVNA